MKKVRVVIDTNVFLVTLAKNFRLHWIYEYLISGKFELCVSTDILIEYQEIITRRYGIDKTNASLDFLTLLPNVYLISPHFKWDLLKDPDDNKFIDCAVSGNADFIISNDSDFNILKDIIFPSIKKLTSEEFEVEYKDRLGQ